MTTLILTAAMAFAPAQAGTLRLTNVRTTFGELGGTRPEGKYLPGDAVFVGFDIEGLTVGPDNRAQYRMAMELLDKDGKHVFKQDPADKVDYLPLGGTKIPARAYIIIGMDQPPGQYTMKLTVTDTATRSTQTLDKTFEVSPMGFGIVRAYPSIDEFGGVHAPTTGVVGQAYFIQFAIVGFQKDTDVAKKDPINGFQPNVTVAMEPLDENGKPTMAKPESYTQNLESKVKLDPNEQMLNVRFLLPLSKPGKYIVRLKATDNNANKSATFDLPVVVLPSSN